MLFVSRGFIKNKMEPPSKDYSIKVAAYPFRCLLCDERVKQGEAYVEIIEGRLCLTCGLPARRLRPVMQKEKSSLSHN